MNRLVAVVGPTGSGKSDLALRICQERRGEVVNCDSLQIYRYFDIGTAKLPPDERRGVVHHFIDVLAPDEVFTAGEYARRVRPLLEEICARDRLPVVVGGTGFYLRALIDGLFPGPRRDDSLRRRLLDRHQRRPGSLHRLLTRIDPEAARAIHGNDTRKVIRALEVCLLARRPITSLFREGRDALRGFQVLKLGLNPPRDALQERLNLRCLRMFEAGLVDEVRRILALGFPPSAKPFESLGYRQALQVVRGELNLKEAVFYTQRDTRRYAKRQMTWFRADGQVVWLSGFGDDPAIQRNAIDHLHQFF